MTKRRLIFFGIFGAFHLVSFIFTLLLEYSDASSLLSLLKYISMFKYLTFLGLTLVVTEFVWTWQDQRKAQKLQDEMRLENNTLKAKVYDMQESGKMKPEISRPAAK